MSDKALKGRPVEERLAHLNGLTSYRDPRERAGAGFAELTDVDCMAALAFIRRRLPSGAVDPDDIGPEVLETYYGSSIQHRERLVRWFDRHARREGDEAGTIAIRRLAASVAANQVSGVKFTRRQWAEFAWICVTRPAVFQKHADDARNAFYAILDERLPEFRAAVREIRERRKEAKDAHRERKGRGARRRAEA